jgi:hydrogenase-1 operon protein HyaF
MKKIDIPVVTVGPGTQPADEDGAAIAFMQLPDDMTTFSAPVIPEPEEVVGLDEALALTSEMVTLLRAYKKGDRAKVIELDLLDIKKRQFFDQLLGEGEVSVQCGGDLNTFIQESVLAGVWRVQYTDGNDRVIRDTIEVASIPGVVSELSFLGAKKTPVNDDLVIPEDVYNAPPLLAEISDHLHLPDYKSGNSPHVINLSLLPHTEKDILFLTEKLGIGPIVILSRGYGNCRISSTGTRHVWWVQYYNSQDTLILNTLEISRVPEVACASPEDIEDSAKRLEEILSIYQ